MLYAEIEGLGKQLQDRIGRVMIGQEETTRLLLAALLAGGHVLLEAAPGTGKTTLAKTLAAALDCRFERIQFTPDLLPSDITGVTVYRQQTGAFEFVRGPVFTNVLLADELNRATPRTQAALLECMEERQVTENGVTYRLDVPFLVIATQNPVETQGTFPLPEAQLDRFLMRLRLSYPTEEEAVGLMKRMIRSHPLDSVTPVTDGAVLAEAGRLIRSCEVSDDLMAYMARLCEAARDRDKALLGPSPRAMLMLMRAAQALAALQGRDYVIPDDVKTLALPVLAHRVIPRGYSGQRDGTALLETLLDTVPAPTE